MPTASILSPGNFISILLLPCLKIKVALHYPLSQTSCHPHSLLLIYLISLYKALFYSSAYKSSGHAGWTSFRHWISVYSFFPDPCLCLCFLSLCISTFDPLFNAHIPDFNHNTVHRDIVPSQNFSHRHGPCLAPSQMLLLLLLSHFSCVWLCATP